MKPMRHCPSCREYTLRHTCATCTVPTENVIPQRYSPLDKYGRYRREAKMPERKAQGIL